MVRWMARPLPRSGCRAVLPASARSPAAAGLSAALGSVFVPECHALSTTEMLSTWHVHLKIAMGTKAAGMPRLKGERDGREGKKAERDLGQLLRTLHTHRSCSKSSVIGKGNYALQ